MESKEEVVNMDNGDMTTNEEDKRETTVKPLDMRGSLEIDTDGGHKVLLSIVEVQVRAGEGVGVQRVSTTTLALVTSRSDSNER